MYDNNSNITTTQQEFLKLESKFNSNLKILIELSQKNPQQDKSVLLSIKNIFNLFLEKIMHLIKNNSRGGIVNINHANVLIFNSYNNEGQNINRVIRFFLIQ